MFWSTGTMNGTMNGTWRTYDHATVRRAAKVQTLSADEELAADIMRRTLPASVAEWHIRLRLFPPVRDAQFVPIACTGPATK